VTREIALEELANSKLRNHSNMTTALTGPAAIGSESATTNESLGEKRLPFFPTPLLPCSIQYTAIIHPRHLRITLWGEKYSWRG
jgi:hypothetical protein